MKEVQMYLSNSDTDATHVQEENAHFLQQGRKHQDPPSVSCLGTVQHVARKNLVFILIMAY